MPKPNGHTTDLFLCGAGKESVDYTDLKMMNDDDLASVDSSRIDDVRS